MTGSQILAAFESIGAVVQLTPAGVVNVESPDVPGLERLVAEVKANRSEVVEELKRYAAPAHPCIGCRAETEPEDLFCPACWEKRLARMPLDVAERRRRLEHARREIRAGCLAPSPPAARTATCPASAIPPEDGAA